MSRLLFWNILILAVEIVVFGKESQRRANVCTWDNYHYEFTDCDADGGRWIVGVPNNPRNCFNEKSPIPPRRLRECYKSCEAGQFLNLTSLECEDCDAGTYSLGGGVVFDEWDPLPQGFRVKTEKFRSMFASVGRQFSSVNCSKLGWTPRGDVIASAGGPCVATLLYSAHIVKPGRLRFTYQYADDSVFFQFQASSDQCESIREAQGSQFPVSTGEGVWRTEEIPLHVGTNILQWKTVGIDSHRAKPVMIKIVEIEGVGYTSSCNPCPEGYYSPSKAAKRCNECPKNTYSSHKSVSCTPCQPSEYSRVGSGKCIERPPCLKSDYFPVQEPCINNVTRVSFRWAQPKICVETQAGSVTLPPPERPTECPPCNPGTEYRDGSCKLCRPNEYSDGMSKCVPCPSNTQPSRGHHITQWYSWPEKGLQVACISPEDSGCSNSLPWKLYGNYTQSGTGHEKWVYLVLTLSVAGFRTIAHVSNEFHQIGRVVFAFEMKCAHDCELLFMQSTSSRNASIIERWIGSHSYEEFSYPIYRNGAYNFSWAFQKLGWSSSSGDLQESDEGEWSEDDDNWVRIYHIHVQNSIDGGAATCVPCGKIPNRYSTMDSTACIPCNPRTINDPSDDSSNLNKDCISCPPDHVRTDPFSTDINSCKPCGQGLITKNGLDCVTDCIVRKGSKVYDLSELKGFYSVRGGSLFTASGIQYYHVFNISFCMSEYATCEKNVTLQSNGEFLSSSVYARVCQSTIFPPSLGPASLTVDSLNGGGMSSIDTRPLSTHASSLGDSLVGITFSSIIHGVPSEEDILNQLQHPEQFHFLYSTSERTIGCAKGRNTTLTLRCKKPSRHWNPNLSYNASFLHYDNIRTPDKCPDGTCDGCNFHLIWETPLACHLCTENELKVVKGECINGFQEIHYLPSTHSECLPKVNSTWPTYQKCRNSLPVFAEVAIQMAVGLALVLFVTLVCFWRRHRKLEYKYMKLVASSSSMDANGCDSNAANASHGTQLPVAESCGIDPNSDDEDDEDDELYGRRDLRVNNQPKEVMIQSDSTIRNLVSRISFLDKLKSLKRNEASENQLEIMHLTDETCT